MLLSEAKEILKDNGYILEQTYFDWMMSGSESMNLIRGGKPTKTYFILKYLYENGETPAVMLNREFFHGNTDNMKTWAAGNSKYISTRKVGNRRFFSIKNAGINAFKEVGEI